MAAAPRTRDPSLSRAVAAEIVRALRDAGHIAYFAGGCVRDELLGLPATDYDIATDATPASIRAIFPRTAEVGAAFGVVIVKDRAIAVEVATFRSDGPYSDRRRPDQVRFSDPESDARRRDFTINAVFLDPHGEPDTAQATGLPARPRGRVIDFVGGLDDLRARLLRAVGDPDQRLAEDHLRALRAIRFAARYGLALDPATSAAIRRHAVELAGVSRERIGDELRRMLGHPSRATALALLEAHALDAPVLGPGAPKGKAGDSTLLAHLSVDAPPMVVLAAWLLARGLSVREDEVNRAVSGVRAALLLSNDERADLAACLAGLARLQDQWPNAGVAVQKRLAGSPWFENTLMLLEALNKPAYERVKARAAELAATPGGVAPPPLLTGDDLVAMGLSPGPAFKGLLDRVYDAQLEGRVLDKVGALELARTLSV